MSDFKGALRRSLFLFICNFFKGEGVGVGIKRKKICAFFAFLLISFLSYTGTYASGYIGKTFAVFDFIPDSTAENDPDLDYLAVWLGLMVSKNLQLHETVKVVERKELISILEELNLGSSEIVSSGERLKLGKLTGADYLVFGSYVKAGTQIMLSARLVNSRSAIVVKSNNVFGTETDIDNLTAALSYKLLKDSGLSISREDIRQTGKSNLSRIGAYYLQGLDLEKKHDYEGAIDAYKKALSIDHDNPWVKKRIKSILVQ